LSKIKTDEKQLKCEKKISLDLYFIYVMDDHNLFLKTKFLLQKHFFLSGDAMQKCPQMARFF
jgi:hypothetical protein